MEVSGQHRFDLPRDKVWQFLLDPEVLKASLPGCEKLEEVGPDEYVATMKIGISFIRGTFTGKVKITDKNEPESYKMAVEGSGPQGRCPASATWSWLKTMAARSSSTRATPTCAARWRGSEPA